MVKLFRSRNKPKCKHFMKIAVKNKYFTIMVDTFLKNDHNVCIVANAIKNLIYRPYMTIGTKHPSDSGKFNGFTIILSKVWTQSQIQFIFHNLNTKCKLQSKLDRKQVNILKDEIRFNILDSIRTMFQKYGEIKF